MFASAEFFFSFCFGGTAVVDIFGRETKTRGGHGWWGGGTKAYVCCLHVKRGCEFRWLP